VKLSPYQVDVLAGRVFWCNDRGIKVSAKDYITACAQIFNIHIGETTALRYLKKSDITSHTLQKCSIAKQYDGPELAKMLWDWVKKMKDDGFFAQRPRQICSLDFTYTGQRTNREKTFSQRGGGQPKSIGKISTYTNCIITNIWADGVNKTPAMLFTYNPAFRTDRQSTKNWREKYEYLKKCLSEFGIQEDRIKYIGKAKKETRHYAAESPDLVKKFFARKKAPANSYILSDQGHSLGEDGGSVLTTLGFKRHETYPAPVHQYLSPNDNKLHGTAKQAWRKAGLHFEDDVRSSIMLLSLLDKHTIAHSKTWFDANMRHLKENEVCQLISNCNAKKIQRKEKLKWLYLNGQGVFKPIDQTGIPKKLQTTLDGEYYRQ
jgi:hypothetical protein